MNINEPARSGNVVLIDGLLSEINLEEGTFEKGGKTMNCIKGSFKVQTQETINNKSVDVEIPVYVFASQYKNDGVSLNASYENLLKVKNEYVSIAAGGKEQASAISLNGSIRMNEYYSKDGRLLSYPRIYTSFVNKVNKAELTPRASFKTKMVIQSLGPELDSEGVETGRYQVVGIIPQWGGKVDVVKFFAANDNVASHIATVWDKGDTVNVDGKLCYKTEVSLNQREDTFGEINQSYHTTFTSDLLITGGDSNPAEGEYAYDLDQIKEALAERKANLESRKVEATSSTKKVSKKSFDNLGF